MLELIIIFIIAIALIAIGYLSYMMLKEDIDGKIPMTTLKDTVDQININDQSLKNSVVDVEENIKTEKTMNDSIFSSVNSNIMIINDNLHSINSNMVIHDKAIDIVNSNINNMQGSNVLFNTDLTLIKDNYISTTFLKSDYASIDNNVFTIAPKNYSQVSITGKPLQVDSVNVTDWKISPIDGKLCFVKDDKKTMCINNNPSSLELYKMDGSFKTIYANETIIPPIVNTPVVTTSTTDVTTPTTVETTPTTTTTTTDVTTPTVSTFINKKKRENFIKAQ